MKNELDGKWALVLGASSGFGAACSQALAGAGMNIFGVHLDRKATLPRANEVIAGIEALGGEARFFNVNAADGHKRQRVLDAIVETLAEGPERTVHVVLHSLAFGTLLPFVAEDWDDADSYVSQAQMEMTLDVMAHSLVYWVQDLLRHNLLGEGSRVFSMTSAGSHRVVPTYGAVSAAKAALESHTRQLAMELADRGIMVNCLQAGVTDTPALRAIPGSERLVEEALKRQPSGRLTTTEDLAASLVALSDPRVGWINGAIIRVDGGEDVIG